MRATLLLIALALAACGERKPTEFERAKAYWEKQYPVMVKDLMKQGMTREKAEELASRAVPTDEEIRGRIYEREQNRKALREATCENAPYLDRCN